MSVGADSLMGHLDISKLLDKETLERGRAKQNGTNVQIKEIVKAMMDSEPCLFHNSEANLMTVSENDQ